MNLVGRSYLAAKNVLHVASTKTVGEQQALTQRFLSEWEAHEDIDDQELLSDMLSHTAEHVPFYRNYFRENTHKNIGSLTDWPILTRDILRRESSRLQSDTPPRGKSWSHASGGSTGKPVAVIHDEYFAAKAQALRDLCAKLFFEGPHYNKLILWGMNQEIEKEKCGDGSLKSEIKGKLLQLGGLKTSHINTFNFTREKFDECVRIVNHQKPEFIFGYAGSVYQLAKHMAQEGIEPAKKPVKIGTTAQTLYPFMRKQIEAVFGCAVCDHYGSREAGPVAWQHPDGHMYFPKFFCNMEVVDDQGRPCANGEQGRILLTTLHNFAMPLIRYEVGDLGVAGPDVSFSGYPFSTLSSITGKSNEEFVRKDGTLVHGQFFINLFYYRPWLDEFCVVQKEHELVDILYVLADKSAAPPPEDVADIEARIRSVMTESCRVQWQEVDEIPVTAAGKRLYIRSEVTRDAVNNGARAHPA